MSKKSKVESMWQMIPGIKCKGLCTESCGPVNCSDTEKHLIKQYCKNNGIKYNPWGKFNLKKVLYDITQASDEELVCPYLKDGKCEI